MPSVVIWKNISTVFLFSWNLKKKQKRRYQLKISNHIRLSIKTIFLSSYKFKYIYIFICININIKDIDYDISKFKIWKIWNYKFGIWITFLLRIIINIILSYKITTQLISCTAKLSRILLFTFYVSTWSCHFTTFFLR